MILADYVATKAKIVFFRILNAFVYEPEKDVAQAPIIFNEFEPAIANFEPEVAKQQANIKLDASKTPTRALMVEYARFFISPFKFSVPFYIFILCYLGSKLPNYEISNWVSTFYEKAGLAFRNQDNESPDHSTMETEFLPSLCLTSQANAKSLTEEDVEYQRN